MEGTETEEAVREGAEKEGETLPPALPEVLQDGILSLIFHLHHRLSGRKLSSMSKRGSGGTELIGHLIGMGGMEATTTGVRRW